MFERMHAVPCENLLLEEENPDFFNQCNRELRLGLYTLPEGGSLIVNLELVKFADEAYFYDTIATLQGMTGGPLESKHLLILKPQPQVLQSLTNAIDMASECFMYMDEKGVIRPVGKVLNPTLLKTMIAILEADAEGETLSAAELRKKLGIANVQVCAEALKRLFNWGFITRKEEPGNRGRPVIKYFAYWPMDNRHWPSGENTRIRWEIPLPKDKSNAKTFDNPYLKKSKAAV